MSSNNFTEVRLVDICDLISRGITPSYTDNKEEGIVVLNQKCIRDNRINLELSRLTNPNKKKITESKFLKKYDILVNSTGVGTLGRVAQIKNLDCKMTVDSHITIIRPKEEINPIFLGYNLFMNQKYIESLGEGSTGQTELSRVRLGEVLKIKVPKLIEQKAIAKILSDLDEKIEINNKINENLEKIAQAIFKQWFVDFEFPNENGEPYKSSGGEMIESELGEIPKGWDIKNLNDIVEIKYGKNLPTKNLIDNGYPVFGGNGIIGYYSDYLYEKPQILIACRGAASGKVTTSLPFSYITNNSLVLENKEADVFYEYLKQYCLYRQFFDYKTGSAQPQITINNLINIKVIVPNREIIKIFSKIIRSIDKNILNSSMLIKRLINTRDNLLPKLMSGEIRVPLD